MLPIHHPMPMGHQRDDPFGSSFKPFVYATAFEMGWYPGTVVPDIRTYFPNGAPAGTQSRTLLYIALPTIARLVTQITMVEIDSPQSGRRLPNHKTSAQ